MILRFLRSGRLTIYDVLVITIEIFTFLFAWNDLPAPLMMYLRSPDHFIIATGLASFRSQTDISGDLQ